MRVNIKQFALYTGLCRQSASKHYKMYLELINTGRRHLIVNDICKIDGVTESYVLERLGFKIKNVNKS